MVVLNSDEDMSMIRIDRIAKTYKMGDVEVHALRGVSLEVKQGEMVALMGPSGSGKSTLMNVIGCLDQPTSGTYELDGMNVGGLSDNKLAEIRNRKVGFVFQTYNLLSRTSALANVELPLTYGGEKNRHKRALEVLKRVGLSGRVRHKPNELSGGEQQRVSIARALINNPAIILADEPTGNLDTRTGAEIMAIFAELNRNEGMTIVLVTHEREIAAYTQRVIHLRDGLVDREETLTK